MKSQHQLQIYKESQIQLAIAIERIAENHNNVMKVMFSCSEAARSKTHNFKDFNNTVIAILQTSKELINASRNIIKKFGEYDIEQKLEAELKKIHSNYEGYSPYLSGLDKSLIDYYTQILKGKEGAVKLEIDYSGKDPLTQEDVDAIHLDFGCHVQRDDDRRAKLAKCPEPEINLENHPFFKERTTCEALIRTYSHYISDGSTVWYLHVYKDGKFHEPKIAIVEGSGKARVCGTVDQVWVYSDLLITKPGYVFLWGEKGVNCTGNVLYKVNSSTKTTFT